MWVISYFLIKFKAYCTQGNMDWNYTFGQKSMVGGPRDKPTIIILPNGHSPVNSSLFVYRSAQLSDFIRDVSSYSGQQLT